MELRFLASVVTPVAGCEDQSRETRMSSCKTARLLGGAEEGSILVLTADGKGVPLVKSDAQRLRAFREKAVRPGNRRMSTVCSVCSVEPYHRTAEDVVAGLFREDKAESELTSDRPVPQHKHLMAKLPGVIEDLGDEMVRGSILALSWAAREVQQRRKKAQLLVRLMDGQHSLCRMRMRVRVSATLKT